MAPNKEPDLYLQIKNNRLTRNILTTHITVGIVKKVHLPWINTNPKCEICVRANAVPSIMDAFVLPTDFAKLEWTIPLKNNSSPIGLKIIPVAAIMKNMTSLSFPLIPSGML
jgi:hypothetical protein